MGRTTTPLSDVQIKRAKTLDKEYKLFDGDGLHVVIKTNGKKVWRVSYRWNGKTKTYTIGEYPVVTLSQARQITKEVKHKAKSGIDPVQDRRDKIKNQQVPVSLTFREIAYKWLDFKESEYSSTHYAKQLRRVEIYLINFLGNKHVDDITKKDIINLIQKIPTIETRSTRDTNKIETARRIFTILGQIYKWAAHHDLVKQNIPAMIDINTFMPKSKPTKLKALTKPHDIRQLYGTILQYPGSYETVQALKFLALTALRPGNVSGLKWSYIDDLNDIIEFPPETMKLKQTYRLPLTPTLKNIIRNMQPLTFHRSEYVFCSPIAPSKQMSNNTLNLAHKRMGFSDHNAHGWRSAFSTICYEHQREHGFSSEVIESQLAHKLGNSVKMAYLRSDFLDERKLLLAWWEQFLSKKDVEKES